MTKDKDFKKLVRSRMTTTGENFTAARRALLDTNTRAMTPTAAAIASEPAESVESSIEPAEPSIERFRTKTLKTFMPNRRITAIPTKRRALAVLLIEVLAAVDADRIYEEKQLNALLAEFHPDFALLRRELIDYRLLERDAHTGRYWVNPNPPTYSGSQAQEMAGLAAFLR
ncbi:DUF2087 domain-containing protein [Brevibacterium spongiae]|uniref:DUF2087 domain-containing protein n=1 Tax=Brevibacterium spongiae TaxID=2909672 RepID=A0ABY5SWN6_9MICO|nr:DUF2087 domain-containing protein [Brevibacterium spongiae]UVI37554.1 DUF2087 domain-containing protein [Brevibacterium spongiae]